jgi:hypothetical protein
VVHENKKEILEYMGALAVGSEKKRFEYVDRLETIQLMTPVNTIL